MARHIFRMTYWKNVETFVLDGALHATNHANKQKCYRTSYKDIVHRRGTQHYQTPCGRVLNDFVPFYFSPITAMAYTIHRGNVDLIEPCSDRNLGKATLNDLVFLICNTDTVASSGLSFWFTNIACNSALQPSYENDLKKLDNHIAWSLFDDYPRLGTIEEIEYNGVCKYFLNADDPERYKNRSSQRMAEFMILNHVPLGLIDCIVTQNMNIKNQVEMFLNNSQWHIPVYVKPGCYFE